MYPALSAEEHTRYARHLALPQFGGKAQQQLKTARVLVVGAGGLGSPLLLYLAAAGVGTLGIVEDDRVEISNLQRQVLYGTADLGCAKTQAAQLRLNALNPHVQVNLHAERLTPRNARSVIGQYDLVADGSDNFPTRYLVNDICVQLNKPCVYGSVNQFEGQVAVFHAPDAQGTYSPNYRDLYPTPPPSDMVPDCATGGVLGVLPGIIGSMQALEVIKLVTGVGQPLTGRLLVFDGLTMESRIFKYKHRPDKQALTEKMISDDYNSFCGIVDDKEEEPVQEVTPAALRQWQAAGIPLQYIDVREPMEHLSDPFGGTLLPLSVIVAHADKIAQDRKVVIYCQTGLRSATAVRLLQRQYGWNHLYNLSGGVKEWVKTRHSP